MPGYNGRSDSWFDQRHENDIQFVLLLQHPGANDVTVCQGQ